MTDTDKDDSVRQIAQDAAIERAIRNFLEGRRLQGRLEETLESMRQCDTGELGQRVEYGPDN